MNADTEAQGRADYEAHVKAHPTYHDGKPRKTWDQLSPLCKRSWIKNFEAVKPAPYVTVPDPRPRH